MRIFFILLILTSALLHAKQETAYEKGRSLYFANGCANCHGTNGEGSSYYPKLANKKQNFLKEKLTNFKNGIATTQKQEIMFTFADALSNTNIEDITYFLAKFKKDTSDKYNVEDDLLGVDY